MSLVVRIRADIDDLTKGFTSAIQAADAFEKKLSNISVAGAFGNLVQDMQHVSKGLGGAGLKIHAFAKDAAVATRGLTQATANLTTKLGPLANALDKATNSMSRFSQTARARLPQATSAIQQFSNEAQAAITPVSTLFNQMGAGVRQAGRAANSLNGVSQAAQGMGAILTENTSLWTRFTVALGGALIGSMVSQVFWRLGDALLRLPGLMVELAGSLEQTKIALNTMVGEGAKADKFLRDLQAFAVETPFEFEGLMKSAKMLMAMGINSRAILPILRAVGDSLAAVGGTSYQIENVSRALAQMAAKGKLNAEELNQLAENGIPAVDMLAKKIGVSTGKIMEMAEKSQLAAAKYLPMLINEMESRFTGMMEKQNKTITGSLAMLSDAFKLTFGEIGKRIIELTGLTDKVRALASAFMVLGTAVREQGLPGLFSAAFGKTSQNSLIGFAAAIAATSSAAVFMAARMLATLPALAQMRAAIIATSVATLKQTLIFAGIAAAAYSVGVNFRYLAERAQFLYDIMYETMQGNIAVLRHFVQAAQYMTNAFAAALTGNTDNMRTAYVSMAKSMQAMHREIQTVNARLHNAIDAPFKEKFVNPVAEIGKAWSAFTSMFEEKSSKVKLGAEKVTTAMLGIAGGIDAVKQKDISKKLEAEANRAMATKNAYEALQTSLQGIIAKEIELGYAYDENRAIADALSPVISALTAQYGKKSKQVQDLIKTQQLYRKLSIEVSQVEQRRYKDLQQILAVGTRLSANLKEIADDAEDQGRSFNVAERQAKAYKVALKELRNVKISDNAGLTQFVKGMDLSKIPNVGDDIIKGIVAALKKGDKTQIEKAIADLIGALDLEAAQFDVGKIIEDETRQFDIAKARALALGEAFDDVGERVKMNTKILEKLTEKGTKPAIDAAEEYKKKLADLQNPILQANLQLGVTIAMLGGVVGAFSAVNTLLSTFGLNIGDSAKATLEFAGQFVSSMNGVVTSVATLGAAWQTFSVAFAANPVLLGLLAIAAGTALVIGGVMSWMNAEKERAAQSQKFQKEYLDNLREMDAKLTETNMAAMEAFEARGEVVRMLSDEEMNGVLALIDRYDELNWQLSVSENAAADVLSNIREEIKKTADELNAVMPAATQTAMRKSSVKFQTALSRWQKDASIVAAEAAAKISNSMKGGIIDSLKSAGKAFLEGAEDWQYKLRQGIRDAVISGIVDAMVKKSIIDVIMPDVERLANTLQKGLYVDPSQVQAIFSKADRLGSSLERVLGPVRDVITGFRVEAPQFNESFRGVIEGANQLMTNALASGDILGVGRAALEFQSAQAAAYGNTTVNVNYTGRGMWTEQDARELGAKIVAQINRAGKG